jgi:hypothetical protein
MPDARFIRTVLQVLKRLCWLLMLLCTGLEDFQRVHHRTITHSHHDLEGAVHSYGELLGLGAADIKDDRTPANRDSNQHSHVIELLTEVPATIARSSGPRPPSSSKLHPVSESPTTLATSPERGRLLRPPRVA